MTRSMLLERLEILVTPGLLLSRRARLFGSKPGALPAVAQPPVQDRIDADWRPAMAGLRNVLVREARYGTRVAIVLSDLWVRTHLVPGARGDLSAGEMLLLARAHFGRQYPEASQDSWTFRLARQGKHLLAAALESELLEALAAASANAGARLSRVEPLLAWVFDRFGKTLAGANGWMLLDEPGLLTIACLEQGQLTSIHRQRCEGDQDEVALRLLERQSALSAHRFTDVHLFCVDARKIRLPAPWRVVRQQRVFDPENRTVAAPVPGPFLRQH